MEEVKHFINEFWIEHEWEIIFGAIFAVIFAIVMEFIFKPFRHWREKRKALKKYYTFTGKSSSLKHKEERDKVLGWRPFHSYYYPRQEDDRIDGSLKNKENVLIIGHPLSGKSRAAYEALIKLNKPQNVAIARHTNINPETFQLSKKTQIIFIDDLQRFVEQQNFEHLFTTARENKTVIVAACRLGEEYKKVTGNMSAKNMPLKTIFKDENIIELSEIPKEIGKEIANEVGIPWNKVKSKFNHTVGSIFMDLEEMGNRFNNCNLDEKTILRTLRSLYLCGIYEENLLFPLQWIKITAKKVGLEKADYEWTPLLEGLRDKELIISLEGDKVQAEEVYLERIVTPLIEGEILDVSEKTIKIFTGVSNALFSLGNTAYSLETEYMDVAIKAYTSALESWKPEDFPKEWAYNNRGIAYKNKGEFDRAIADFNKALELNPRDAEAYNNRGAAYGKKGDYDRAIADFNKALEINPRDAEAYNNRAVAYYYKKEYDKAWEDVHKAQGLGYQVNPGFLGLLREASGRQR